MSVYDTLDYKEFLRNWVSDRPGGGRGEYRRISMALRVSTTLVSQVVNGDKHFSLELASDLCEYLGLGERDAEHFLLLIEYARAGTQNYKTRLRKRVEAARVRALKLSERMNKDRDLSDAEAAICYSNWSYTGIRHILACDPTMSIDGLADRLNLPRHAVAKVIDFLLASGILVNHGGKLQTGIKQTHLSAESPLVIKHHQNWRLQGFNRMAFTSDEELFYTAPMSLSREVADQVRRELPSFIQKMIGWVGPSSSEVVRCLNIDWFIF